MADKNIQMTQRNASNTGWDNLYPITKASNVQVTPISGLAGTDVQTVLQNLFQFANDGKTQIANAITAKGVSADPTETFASLAAKIGQISTGKKWATGTGTTNGSARLIVTGLNFTPSLVLAALTTIGDRFTLYFSGFPLFSPSGWTSFTLDSSNIPYNPDNTASFGQFDVGFYNISNYQNKSCNWIAIE